MLLHIWLLLSRGIRKRAWVKNLLVFLPVLADEQLVISSWPRFLLLFACFSAVASSIYIFNDAIDVERDRLHPQKQDRIQVRQKFSYVEVAVAVGVLLLIFSLLLIPVFSDELLVCFLAYLFLNVFYSLKLKHIKWVDVGCLAFFLSLRIACGFVLVSHWPGWIWMFGFWLILFVSALMKRFLEVHYFLRRGLDTVRLGRPYGPSTLVHKAAAFSAIPVTTED